MINTLNFVVRFLLSEETSDSTKKCSLQQNILQIISNSHKSIKVTFLLEAMKRKANVNKALRKETDLTTFNYITHK